MATQLMRPQIWLVVLLRKLQTLLERLLLVGAAIAVRKMLERRMSSTRVHVDTEVHGRVGSRPARTHRGGAEDAEAKAKHEIRSSQSETSRFGFEISDFLQWCIY